MSKADKADALATAQAEIAHAPELFVGPAFGFWVTEANLAEKVLPLRYERRRRYLHVYTHCALHVHVHVHVRA